MATIFVPDDFYCPITGALMSDPVSEPDGHTYERSAIIKWLSKNNTSPMTRGGLCVSALKENIALKKSIESIREKLTEEQLKNKSKLLEEDLILLLNFYLLYGHFFVVFLCVFPQIQYLL